MPIDSSIAMSGRQFQLDNPLEVQGKVATLRQLLGQQQLQQMQIQQAQRGQEQEQTLSDLYKGNVSPDGTINRQGLFTAAAQKGLGNKIPGLQKQFADADKATADVGHVGAQTDKLKFDVAKQKMDVSASALNSLLSRPNVTHDDIIQTMVGLVQQGVVTPEQGQQAIREIPGRPEQLRPYLMQKGMQVMDASKRMDLLTPKFEKVDNGGAIQMGTIDQMTGQFTPGQAIRKVQTPDSVASNATAQRGQNMTDSRAREGNDIARQAARTQVVETPDGYALVDKGTGLVRPAATFNGAQVQGKDTGLNDVQSKALLFGSRMKQADKILGTMAAQGVTQPSVIKRSVEGTPLVGGALGALANSTVASPQQQQVEQAQRDFVNAVLRRESGAAIAESEFNNASKQYFPQVGDSKAVVQQKAQNRQLAMQGILAEVPAKKRDSLDPAVNADSGLPDDIAAILKKHGGK